MIKNDEYEDMEQDLKQVLMNSLCAILPYGVIVLDGPAEQRGKLWSVSHDYMVSYESDVSEELERQSIFIVRCYLRPMSSMTEEEREEYLTECDKDAESTLSAPHHHGINWLNKNMFDYCGLIPKGLAIAVTKENNPYKK